MASAAAAPLRPRGPVGPGRTPLQGQAIRAEMNVVPWDTLQTGFGTDNVERPKSRANIFGTLQGRFQTMSLPEHLGQNRRDMPQGDILQASPVLGDMEREAQHRSGDGNETSPSQGARRQQGVQVRAVQQCLDQLEIRHDEADAPRQAAADEFRLGSDGSRKRLHLARKSLCHGRATTRRSEPSKLGWLRRKP